MSSARIPASLQTSFSAWLDGAGREEIPSSVAAYNVGLFESENGFTAYLVGAASYDADDPDWACDEAFSPANRYFELPRDVTGSDWEVAQRVAVAMVRAYLNDPESGSSYLRAAKAVAVGFDDGDLELVS